MKIIKIDLIKSFMVKITISCIINTKTSEIPDRVSHNTF